MVSRINASIPQGTKDWASTTGKSLFNRDHLRSVTVFFGIGEERPFYVEKSPSLLMARLKHNASFFYLNYMLVFCILFVLTMITSFTTMIGIVLLGGAWLYVIKASSGGSLQIGSESYHVSRASTFVASCVLTITVSHSRICHSSETRDYRNGRYFCGGSLLPLVSHFLVDDWIRWAFGGRSHLFERR